MAVLCRPLSARESKTSLGIRCGYLFLPPGWVASRGFFHLVTHVIRETQLPFGPPNTSWNTPDAYTEYLYVDDATFIEPIIGTRPADSIATWEWACKGVPVEREVSTGEMQV